MEINKIVLPGECILIKRDKPLEKTASGIFLGDDSTDIIDTGVIVKTGLIITKKGYNLIGKRVRFRETFGEILMIDNEEYIFFRELEPSIYYYIQD